MKLLPWQTPFAEELGLRLEAHRGAALLAPTGSGKTFMLSWLCARDGHTPAVVCPKSVMMAWERTLIGFGVGHYTVVNYERAIKTERLEGSLFVFDEAHRCKGWNTQAGRLLTRVWQSGAPVVLSTATLAESPLEMRHTGRVLGLHEDERSYWRFVIGAGCAKDRWGGWKYGGGQYGMRRVRRLIEPRIVAIADEQVPDKPETRIQAVGIDIPEPGRVKELFEEWRRKYAGKRSVNERGVRIDVGEAVGLLKARQESELQKVQTMVERTLDAEADGTKVVAFFNFREPLAEYAKALACPQFHGDTPKAERDELERGFQGNALPAIAVMVQAGGVGLGFHDPTGRIPRLVLACPPWSGYDLLQLLGRTPRVGGAFSTQQILFALDTPEEAVMRTVQRKTGNLKALSGAELQRAWMAI